MYPKQTKTEPTKNPISPQGTSMESDPYAFSPSTEASLDSSPTETFTGTSSVITPSAVPLFQTSKVSTSIFRRSIILASCALLLTFLAIGLVMATSENNKVPLTSLSNIPAQKVTINGPSVSQVNLSQLQTGKGLLVNGDIITTGALQFNDSDHNVRFFANNLQNDATISIPASSGELCINSNNCGYASNQQLLELTNIVNSQTNQLTRLINNQDTTVPVNSLNGLNGDISLLGTTNQINVNSTAGAITLSLPQPIDIGASPTFAGLIVTGTPTVGGLTITGTATQSGYTVCDSSNNCGYASSGSGTGDVNQGGNNYGVAMTLGTIDNFGVNLKTNNVVVASFSPTGAVTFQNSVNSANAFRILNSSNVSLFTVDTLAGTVTITGLSGSGALLTNLNASNISSGTLNDARLSGNVTVQGNTFSGITT